MAGNEASQFQRVLNEVRSERLVEIASAICNAHSPTGGEADVARAVGARGPAELDHREAGRVEQMAEVGPEMVRQG